MFAPHQLLPPSRELRILHQPTPSPLPLPLLCFPPCPPLREPRNPHQRPSPPPPFSVFGLSVCGAAATSSGPPAECLATSARASGSNVAIASRSSLTPPPLRSTWRTPFFLASIST